MKKRIKQYINNYNLSDLNLISSCGLNYKTTLEEDDNGIGYFYVVNSNTPIDIKSSNMSDYYYHNFNVASSSVVTNANNIFTCNVNNKSHGKIFGIVSSNTSTNSISVISYSEDYGSLYHFANLYNQVRNRAISISSQRSKNYNNTIQADVPEE